MELSQTILIMVHKLTTPVTLDIVLMETDTAPVRMMETGLGQTQLALTKVNCVFVLLIVYMQGIRKVYGVCILCIEWSEENSKHNSYSLIKCIL